jgi:hypothetical protein
MTPFNRALARRRLVSAANRLRLKGPEHAGKVARIEAALGADPSFPFDEKRYEEFCKELGVQP